MATQQLQSAEPQTLWLQDIRLNPLANAELVSLIGDIIAGNESRIIANHNLHSLYLWHREPRMREFFSAADYIHIDGMPVVFLAQLAGLPLKKEHRAAYLDFLPLLLADAAQLGWRIFFLGSEPGVAEKAAEKLRGQYPGLQISTHHGHFNVDRFGRENQEVLSTIREYAPHILMVGMGMPRQEVWILQNRAELNANVICPTGAIMDYIAGVKATPPRWLGPLYLEWLYRLVTEPKRLWRRYLVEPWYVANQMILRSRKSRQESRLAGAPRGDN